ncbi:terminase [Lentilactobacillus buchneri]|uniref:Terminase small subunit n=1 Tax=Lentilactobacillus buchneri DSM 20057 TaxID=1423728 RepID=A0A4R5NPX4_LENBU|nr:MULTISPECIES: hypothetical protein [Lentilactobacillus]KRK67957.1 hypothetical protein FC79_GL001085 [Lentilactobacillus buchneri DSM 20057]MBW0223483.1 terminase [Lentilactobacillus parabuchneri]MCT3253491.1 terminase [Lentilactobacillus buchneri]MCT3548083.1 terminase [Lentilactobacillus buchneri]MCT4438551.1 terminase [Lentilactobacillus buchneri]
MGALKNPRWEKFVQGLITGKSQRQAYHEAFISSKRWKPETVDNHASKLLNKNAKVLARYQELQGKSADKAIMTGRERKMMLTKFAKSKEVAYSDRLKAIDLMNKMDGTYVSNVQLSGQLDTNNALANVSTDDLHTVIHKLVGDGDGS